MKVVLPDRDAQVMMVAGVAGASAPNGVFRFVRVGRILRNEIGDVGSVRPGYASTSFLPAPDAPFGGRLQIGGVFGAGLTTGTDELFYTVSYSPYSGNPSAPFDPAREKFITEPIVNSKYVISENRWVTVPLGPVADVYNGLSIQVYKVAPADSDYWPFRDLIASWKSWEAPNELVILKLTAYLKKQGKPLQKCTLADEFLPLYIDNRPAALNLAGWYTGVADPATGQVSDLQAMSPCSVVEVKRAAGALSNTCIEVAYSIEDGSGKAHPHVSDYRIDVAFTPQQLNGAPLEKTVALQSFLGNGAYQTYADHYQQQSSGFEVKGFTSVLMPADQWPSQEAGCCGMHAAEVRMTCRLRTTDGWDSLFGCAIYGRHLILRAA